ncbi:MAG: restriction endonuclease [Bdellovibrionales bacterium]|nr:restriction endonuclease [Bdellovibrionales bacterium]
MKKFQRSLLHAGLEPKYRKEIGNEVIKHVYPGIKTKEIYNHAIKLIKKSSSLAAIKYSLKKSILQLGPTGFVFEKFVARYFEALGFKTFVGIVLQGEFVRHEVDVVAYKNNFQIYVECKFHNVMTTKNDIKTALYVKARWDDLKNGPDGKYLKNFYIASNTSFTSDAITYAKGCGLMLLGVNSPEEVSFLDLIVKHQLYPITSLRRLKKIYCIELINRNLLLCSDLLKSKKILLKIGMSEEEIKNIFRDINRLLS